MVYISERLIALHSKLLQDTKLTEDKLEQVKSYTQKCLNQLTTVSKSVPSSTTTLFTSPRYTNEAWLLDEHSPLEGTVVDHLE
jgi:hypothetical protein